jgi:hypothetical protein
MYLTFRCAESYEVSVAIEAAELRAGRVKSFQSLLPRALLFAFHAFPRGASPLS